MCITDTRLIVNTAKILSDIALCSGHKIFSSKNNNLGNPGGALISIPASYTHFPPIIDDDIILLPVKLNYRNT